MPFIGIATRFNQSEYGNRTTLLPQIKQYMIDHGLNVIRIGASNPTVLPGTSDTFPWNNGFAVDWFLQNTDFTVVVDRNHTINITSTAQIDLDALDASLLAVANDPRWTTKKNQMILEAINEYGGNDFYPTMQGILDRARDNGITHRLVFNRMGFSASQPTTDYGYGWQELIDRLNLSSQGGHYYQGHPGSAGTNLGVPYASDIGTRCFNGMSKGFGIVNQPMFATENGADWEEVFSQAEVDQLGIFLQKCVDVDFSAVVWMNHGLNNRTQYDNFGLVYPVVQSETNYAFSHWQDGDANPIKTVNI